MLVENSVFSCLEQLQKYQSDLMKSLQEKEEDEKKKKENDKKLDACTQLISAIIKFRRVL
jgi:hypothetical protein